jgi:hypothetical protein
VAATSLHPQLVDPAISRAKLDAELESWREHANGYLQRGMLLLRAEGLEVDVAFAGCLPFGGAVLPVIAPTIRLNFDNYDLWAPSLRFIDFFTGRETPSPIPATIAAPDGSNRHLLIERSDGRQFLCVQGTREYHEHSDHDGDLWELHRGTGRGTLAAICEDVLATMTSTIAGVGFQMQVTLAMPNPQMPVTQALGAAQQMRANHDQAVDNFNKMLAEREQAAA